MIKVKSLEIREIEYSYDKRSREYIELTKKLAEAGKIMGIVLLDHVIIGYDRNYGFKECGIL
jgi:DNA repair protein RadC